MNDLLEGGFLAIKGDAPSIIASFTRCAKAAGWSKERIAEVVKEARGGDEDHLLSTISKQYKFFKRRTLHVR